MGSQADSLLRDLSTRQHLQPHVPLGDVLGAVTDDTGLCPQAAERAVGWLGLDPERAIGRLRRSELSQLAQSIDRFWREGVEAVERGH